MSLRLLVMWDSQQLKQCDYLDDVIVFSQSLSNSDFMVMLPGSKKLFFVQIFKKKVITSCRQDDSGANAVI